VDEVHRPDLVRCGCIGTAPRATSLSPSASGICCAIAGPSRGRAGTPASRSPPIPLGAAGHEHAGSRSPPASHRSPGCVASVRSDQIASIDSDRSIVQTAAQCRRGGSRPARLIEARRPVAASGQVSQLSTDHVLQHLLVERQVCHDALQPPVLFLKLPQPLHLRRHQPGILSSSN